jgi:hypothetical protein
VRTVDDVSKLKKEYLDCRDRGHAWFDVKTEPSLRRTSHGMVYRVLDCHRCKTKREDLIIRSTGSIESRRYYYPDGYQVKAGHNVVKAEIRKLAVRAAFAALRRVS